MCLLSIWRALKLLPAVPWELLADVYKPSTPVSPKYLSSPPSPYFQVLLHQRTGVRAFLDAEPLVRQINEILQNVAHVYVVPTEAGTLPAQAAPFLGADVTIMSHGGALGFYQFMPHLSAWVDVTYGNRAAPRRFVTRYAKDTPTWGITPVYYFPNRTEMKVIKPNYNGMFYRLRKSKVG